MMQEKKSSKKFVERRRKRHFFLGPANMVGSCPGTRLGFNAGLFMEEGGGGQGQEERQTLPTQV